MPKIHCTLEQVHECLGTTIATFEVPDAGKASWNDPAVVEWVKWAKSQPYAATIRISMPPTAGYLAGFCKVEVGRFENGEETWSETIWDPV